MTTEPAAAPVQDATVEEQQPSASQAVETNQGEATQEDTNADVRISEGAEVSGGEVEPKKQTRAERRIHELTGKLRGKEEAKQYNPFSDGLPMLDTGGTGEVTIDQLERYVDNKVAMALAHKDMTAQQLKVVEDWKRDLEDTVRQYPELDEKSKEYDPELESRLASLVEKANREGDLLTPRIKTSEIIADIMAVRERERVRGQSETTASMARSMANEAVRPGGAADSSVDVSKLTANTYKNAEQILKEARKQGLIS